MVKETILAERLRAGDTLAYVGMHGEALLASVVQTGRVRFAGVDIVIVTERYPFGESRTFRVAPGVPFAVLARDKEMA